MVGRAIIIRLCHCPVKRVIGIADRVAVRVHHGCKPTVFDADAIALVSYEKKSYQPKKDWQLINLYIFYFSDTENIGFHLAIPDFSSF